MKPESEHQPSPQKETGMTKRFRTLAIAGGIAVALSPAIAGTAQASAPTLAPAAPAQVHMVKPKPTHGTWSLTAKGVKAWGSWTRGTKKNQVHIKLTVEDTANDSRSAYVHLERPGFDHLYKAPGGKGKMKTYKWATTDSHLKAKGCTDSDNNPLSQEKCGHYNMIYLRSWTW
jgi:hypothetical protein